MREHSRDRGRLKENIQVKAAVAVWTFYLLYRNMQNCQDNDRPIFQLLICHIIGTNGNTFAKLMDKIKDKNYGNFKKLQKMHLIKFNTHS